MEEKDKEKILKSFTKDWFQIMTSTEAPTAESSTDAKGKTATAHWQIMTKNKKAPSIEDIEAKEKKVSTETKISEIREKLKSTPISPTYSQATKKFKPEEFSGTKPWYNKNLSKINPQLYEAFSQLHTISQRSQLRPIDFHLSNIERILISEIEKRDSHIYSLEENIKNQNSSYQKARLCADNMITYCKLESSDLWIDKMLKISNPVIQQLLQNLNLTDMVKVRIKDFGSFLDAFKSKDQIFFRIQKELKVHELLDLYLQNLVPANTVIHLLQTLNHDAAADLFVKESVYHIIDKHPCILVEPQQILKYEDHIKRGLVREFYYLPHMFSEQPNFVPTFIFQYCKKLNTSFHMVIKISIYAIWEEIHQLHQHNSFQLWVLSWATQIPQYDVQSFDKTQPDVTEERIFSSYLFHKKIRDLYDEVSYIEYTKHVVLYSTLSKSAKPLSQSDLISMIFVDTNDALGPYGSEGQSKYLDEEMREALMDATQDQDSQEEQRQSSPMMDDPTN